MGLDSLGDAGIGIVAAVLIIREVMGYLKAREASSSSGGDDADCDEAIGKLNKIDDKVDDIQSGVADLRGATVQMSAILSKTDPDGLPLCYSPRSLTTSLSALSNSVEKLGDKIDRGS
jgi:hypothetical protein|tara:strand:+ start:1337 stop:1690 length:354 start_codon:yes stop_codon:yes gene_type:complete